MTIPEAHDTALVLRLLGDDPLLTRNQLANVLAGQDRYYRAPGGRGRAWHTAASRASDVIAALEHEQHLIVRVRIGREVYWLTIAEAGALGSEVAGALADAAAPG